MLCKHAEPGDPRAARGSQHPRLLTHILTHRHTNSHTHTLSHTHLLSHTLTESPFLTCPLTHKVSLPFFLRAVSMFLQCTVIRCMTWESDCQRATHAGTITWQPRTNCLLFYKLQFVCPETSSVRNPDTILHHCWILTDLQNARIETVARADCNGWAAEI